MMHKNTQGIRRRRTGGLRPRLFALLGLVLLAGLVLSQCGNDGVGGSGGEPIDDGDPPLIAGSSGGTPFPFSFITAGDKHTCALVSRQALCWGDSVNGQLGNGTSGANADEDSPVAVKGVRVGGVTPGTLTGVTAITAGVKHTCALVSGQALCWGAGGSGQLGNGASGANADEDSPVAVKGVRVGGVTPGTLTGVTAITAGDKHTCAVIDSRIVNGQVVSGQALCWGAGGSGQLGNVRTIGGRIPKEVGAVNGTMMNPGTLRDVTEIAAGVKHTCAVVASGEALCWGSNGFGRLGDGDTMDRPSPVAVGGGC